MLHSEASMLGQLSAPDPAVADHRRDRPAANWKLELHMDSQLDRSHDELLDLSDLSLLDLTRTGNEEAFVALWQRHQGAGLRAARSISSKLEPEDMLQEAFARILSAIRGNAGPREVFRPYLYSVLRSISMSWTPKGAPTTPLHEVFPGSEPAYSFEGASLDKTVTSRAFANLKPEWRKVLWYIEVEGMTPREVAPLLGMTPNAVSALAIRAKEGLRVSWLQAHLNTAAAEPSCKWYVEHLGAYNRRGLSKRQHDRVQDHLTLCLKCSILVEEVDNVGRNLGLVLLPLLLGPTTLAGITAHAGLGAALSAAPATEAGAQTGVSAAGHLAAAAGGKITLIAVATAVVLAGVVAALALGNSSETSLDSIAVASHPATIAPPSALPSTDPSTAKDPVATLEPEEAAHPEPIAGDREPLLPVALLLPVVAPPAPSPWPTPSPDPTPSLTPSPSPTLSPSPSPQPEPELIVDQPVMAPIQERGLFLPLLGGTGVPGAQVTIMSSGKPVAQVTVDPSGSWSATPEATPDATGNAQFSAFQVFNGIQSKETPLSAAIALPTPTILSTLQDGPSVHVTFNGPAGATVEAFLDGVPTGNYHQLTGEPMQRTVQQLGPGNHTLSLRFVDLANNLHGASANLNLVGLGGPDGGPAPALPPQDFFGAM